ASHAGDGFTGPVEDLIDEGGRPGVSLRGQIPRPLTKADALADCPCKAAGGEPTANRSYHTERIDRLGPHLVVDPVTPGWRLPGRVGIKTRCTCLSRWW